MDFRFDSGEREISAQAKKTFARHLPAARLLSGEGNAQGWRAVAEDGWLHCGLDPDGDGLPLVMVASVARESGRVLAGDAYATNAGVLLPLLAAHDDAAVLFEHPGFLLADGRETDLAAGSGDTVEWCFGVEPGMSAYRLADDGRLLRYGPEAWQLEPLAGLGLNTGSVRLAAGASPDQEWSVTAPVKEDLWAAVILNAAGLVGLGEQALADTVEYVLQREQFGTVIGRFQAVKHGLADVAVQLEVAWNAVLFAALRPDREAVATAHLHAVAAADEASRAMVQFFGGIAMTWEHHAHLYLKCAQLGRWRFGSADDQALQIGRALVAEECAS